MLVRQRQQAEDWMEDFRQQWNVEMALQVLSSETVEPEPWAEAVKWLLLYGPPEVREILTTAAGVSFDQCFPKVRAMGHNDSGQPYYSLADLAEALGVPVEKASQRLTELQSSLGVEFLVDGDQAHRIN